MSLAVAPLSLVIPSADMVTGKLRTEARPGRAGKKKAVGDWPGLDLRASAYQAPGLGCGAVLSHKHIAASTFSTCWQLVSWPLAHQGPAQPHYPGILPVSLPGLEDANPRRPFGMVVNIPLGSLLHSPDQRPANTHLGR